MNLDKYDDEESKYLRYKQNELTYNHVYRCAYLYF